MKIKINILISVLLFLTISLLFPICSMAQTKLTLENISTGEKFTDTNAKNFLLVDENLFVYIDEPFNSMSLSNDIWVDNTPNSYSGCKISPPNIVNAVKPNIGESHRIRFRIKSKNNSPLIMSFSPEYNVARFRRNTFNWEIGGNEPIPVGSYYAVFQSGESQIVVTIKINPQEIIPPPQQGELIPWNIGKYSVTFQPNQTKTFIARIENNSLGICTRRFEIHFNTMGITVSGSFRMALKEDGTPYITRWGKTEWLDLYASNEGSVDFDMSVPGDILNSPCIYPGDFILTLTSTNAGFGYMRASIYY